MEKTNYKYLSFLLDYKAYYRVDDYGTPKEVNEVEAKLGITFPASYRELHIIMGMNRAFRIGPETNYSFPEYEAMNAAAKRITGSNHLNIDIGCRDFVFSCFSENGFFWFFRLDEGDDPPVYQYEYGEDDFEKVGASFSEFVRNMDWFRGFLQMKEEYPTFP